MQISYSHQAWVNQLHLLNWASEEAAELPQSTCHAGLKGRLKSAAPPQYLYLFTCWAFVINCWSVAGSWRETLSLLSDAAASLQRLLFDPADISPCCHGRQYHISQVHWNCWSFLLTQLAWSRNRRLGRKIPILFSLFSCPWPLGLFLSQLHFNQLFLLHLICRQFVQSHSHHVGWGGESTSRWALLSLICQRWISQYTLTLETLPSHEQTLSPHRGARSCSSPSLCVSSMRTKLSHGPSGGLMVKSSPIRHPPSRKTVRSLSQQNLPSQHYNAVTNILTLPGASSRQQQYSVKAILPQDLW